MWYLGALPAGVALVFALPLVIAVRRVKREAGALAGELAALVELPRGAGEVKAAAAALRHRAGALRLELHPGAPPGS